MMDPKKKKLILELAITKYVDFGSTFMAEKLNEFDQVIVNVETLRLLLLKNGLWQRQRKHKQKHKMRIPKEFYGELAQTDVSFHKWINDSSEIWALVAFIDDATSTILWMEFAKSESTQDVANAFRHYIEKYGSPAAFYLDNHSTYKVNINNPDDEK